MPNWHLDENFHLDESNKASIDAKSEISTYSFEYTSKPLADRQFDVGCDFEISVLSTAAIDLLKLMPEKFRKSQILIDYLDEAGIQVGNWFSNVRDIIKLLNVKTVGTIKYLKYLGALIGVSLPPEDSTTVAELRKTIINAVDWYKVKGTYKSVSIISLIHQFTVNIYDMYTKDYSTFEMVDWFVGDENENPPGLDSSYYKSPHFGIEIVLNKVYEFDESGESGGLGAGDHLWLTSYLDNLYLKLEETRPVHTVPHYLLLLNPKTDEFGNEIKVSGDIDTKVFSDWQFSTKYFDGQTSSEIWDFDDGTYFDESEEGFINSITKWKLGNGGKDISDSDFYVTTVLEGDIDNITITDEKIIFEFIVPKSEIQDDINELGLYIPGAPDTLVVGSSFPKIDKDDRVEIHVVVEVYKKSLI